MPRKKLVNIGEVPKMPTIAEFLTDMAERQRDEIRRLKSEAHNREQRAERGEGEVDPVPGALSITVPEPDPSVENGVVVPDPFVLHPVRIAKKSAPRAAESGNRSKLSKKTVTRSSAKKAALAARNGSSPKKATSKPLKHVAPARKSTTATPAKSSRRSGKASSSGRKHK